MKIKKKKKRVVNRGTIEYICRKCGHIKNYGVLQILSKLVMSFFVMVGIVSIVFTASMLQHYSVKEYVGLQVNLYGNVEAYKFNPELRDIGLKYAKGCEDSEECIIVSVFNGLAEDMEYIPTPIIMDPVEVYKSGVGDCKNLATLYVGILRSFGINAWVDMNLEEKHAVALVRPDFADGEYYYMIDLSRGVPILRVFATGVNHWDVEP